jgi:nitrite reductase (NO-forming)/hydroxylamine reductase
MVNIMARFLQHDPPAPPEWGMPQMKESPGTSGSRSPTAPLPHNTTYNIENFFAVTLRDAGQVALIDGDTKEIVTILNTGYAVHISRPSNSGRYVYTIGRDAQD